MASILSQCVKDASATSLPLCTAAIERTTTWARLADIVHGFDANKYKQLSILSFGSALKCAFISFDSNLIV